MSNYYLYGKTTGKRYRVVAESGEHVWVLKDGWGASTDRPLTMNREWFVTTPPQPEPAEGQKWGYERSMTSNDVATILEVTDRHVIYQYGKGNITTFGARARSKENFLEKFTYQGDA